MEKNVSEMPKVTKIAVTITRKGEGIAYEDELEFKSLDELQQWTTEVNEFSMIANKLHHAVEHAGTYKQLTHSTRSAMWYILRMLSEILNSGNVLYQLVSDNDCLGIKVTKFIETFRRKANEDNNLKEFLLKISSVELDAAMEELQRLSLIEILGNIIWMPYPRLITILVKNLNPW